MKVYRKKLKVYWKLYIIQGSKNDRKLWRAKEKLMAGKMVNKIAGAEKDNRMCNNIWKREM